MINRKKVLFKINGEVVVEETGELYLNQIDEMKWIIASECECDYEDIVVDIIEFNAELSDYDVTVDGLMNWKDVHGKILTGVELLVEFESDEYFKALLDVRIEDFLLIN